MYARVQPIRFRLSLIPALLIALFLLSTIAARAATVNVTMKGFAFDPATLTVNVGDTVTWTNQDTAPHNATADDDNMLALCIQRAVVKCRDGIAKIFAV